MKCSLVGEKARVLAKFLQFLAKIGPDLYIEAVAEGLILGTANTSKSGFARIQLMPSFFMEYDIDAEQITLGQNVCRVSLKACSSIFRSMKSVDTCNIRMKANASKLVIQLHCRQNTTKTHFISILEQETLSAPARATDSITNTLVATQKVFADILTVFNPTEEELTIEATKEKISIKNYVESIHVNRQKMRTQLALDPAEFDTFDVDADTSLTFCLKEWRAFLQLAESLNANITINFETTGEPIEFSMQDLDVFEVTLFMSTLSSELDSSRDVSGLLAVGSQVGNHKRAYDEQVEAELQVALKKVKGRTKKPPLSPESKIQYSDPNIENCTSNNEGASSAGEGTSNHYNRLTVARNGGGRPLTLDVPTISNGTSIVTPPRIDHHTSNNLEVIFLRDTEEDDSDRTLSNIPMPPNIPRQEEDDDVIMIADSPASSHSEVIRREGLSLFRRCYEPSFKCTDITGLNRIVAHDSDDEEAGNQRK